MDEGTQNDALAKEAGVTTLPAFLFYLDGERKNLIVGADAVPLKAKINLHYGVFAKARDAAIEAEEKAKAEREKAEKAAKEKAAKDMRASLTGKGKPAEKSSGGIAESIAGAFGAGSAGAASSTPASRAAPAKPEAKAGAAAEDGDFGLPEIPDLGITSFFGGVFTTIGSTAADIGAST